MVGAGRQGRWRREGGKIAERSVVAVSSVDNAGCNKLTLMDEHVRMEILSEGQPPNGPDCSCAPNRRYT